MSKQSHVINEETDYTTFRSRRGTSNVVLTVINSQLLREVVEWEISEQESCSDRSIIRYATGEGQIHRLEFDSQDVRFIVKNDNKGIFQRNLL
jgi:hypothetical protein